MNKPYIRHTPKGRATLHEVVLDGKVIADRTSENRIYNACILRKANLEAFVVRYTNQKADMPDDATYAKARASLTAKIDELVQKMAKGEEIWSVPTWCGTRALAVKQLTKWTTGEYNRKMYKETQIVETGTGMEKDAEPAPGLYVVPTVNLALNPANPVAGPAEPSRLEKAAAATAIRMVAVRLAESPMLCFFTGAFTQTDTDLKTLLQFHGQPANLRDQALAEYLKDMPRAYSLLEAELKQYINHLADLSDDTEAAMPEHLKTLVNRLQAVIED